MTAQPKFSIVICNYNYAALVGNAIRSALAQDYPPERVQVIVVDDASTDGSRDVYPQFASDPRFQALLQDNRGQTAAFCAGVRAADGDFVCLLDSDDIYLPNKLARVAAHLAILNLVPDQVFLCHDLAIENSQSGHAVTDSRTWFDLTGISQLPDRLTLDQPVTHFPYSIPCGLVFSRALLMECLEVVPAWEFRNGADGVICPSVFLHTGSVHYLRECLGVYRIHGSNAFASMIDGRYTPRFNPLARGPKTQRFLEHWVDTRDKSKPERMLALQYLRNREHLVRRASASRALAEPTVDVVVLGDSDGPVAQESATSSLQSHEAVRFSVRRWDGSTELAAMARAWADTDAEYLVFMRAGDRLDRDFVEQHLNLRQQGTLVGLSCSDLRLLSAQGSLVHTSVMRHSGAWKLALQTVPPMATGLRDWVASPWSTSMLQRNALLDRLFARHATAPPELQAAGFWLTCQFAHHTAGIVRFRETLSSCRLAPGTTASYGLLLAAGDIHGALVTPPVDAALAWLQDFYQQELPLFRQSLPPAWHQRFVAWLAAQRAQ